MAGRMLKGSYTKSVDVKGRMAFPAKLREAMGEELTLTKGLGGCIFVYAAEYFEEKAARLNSLPMSKALTLQRSLAPNATDVEADKQGRILIPSILRKMAQIEDEAVVIGVSDHCEIWNPERWEQINDSISDEMFLQALEGAEF